MNQWNSQNLKSKSVIEPKTKSRSGKDGYCSSAKLAEEDPTFKTYTNEDTDRLLSAGMGNFTLKSSVDRLLREFKVEANVGKPQVSYKETISASEADVDHKYAKQSGGHGQYGHVKIKLYLREPGAGFEFKNLSVGGAIPKEYIPKRSKMVSRKLWKQVQWLDIR